LGDERHAERPLLARLSQDLFGEIGAAATSAGATGGAGQIIQGPGAFGRGPADHVLGNGIADADVHGSSAKGLPDSHLIANENDCQQLYINVIDGPKNGPGGPKRG